MAEKLGSTISWQYWYWRHYGTRLVYGKLIWFYDRYSRKLYLISVISSNQFDMCTDEELLTEVFKLRSPRKKYHNIRQNKFKLV